MFVLGKLLQAKSHNSHFYNYEFTSYIIWMQKRGKWDSVLQWTPYQIVHNLPTSWELPQLQSANHSIPTNNAHIISLISANLIAIAISNTYLNANPLWRFPPLFLLSRGSLETLTFGHAEVLAGKSENYDNNEVMVGYYVARSGEWVQSPGAWWEDLPRSFISSHSLAENWTSSHRGANKKNTLVCCNYDVVRCKGRCSKCWDRVKQLFHLDSTLSLLSSQWFLSQ